MPEASTFLWKIIKLKYYFLTIYSDLLSKVHLQSNSEYIVRQYFNFIIFHKNVLASDNIVYQVSPYNLIDFVLSFSWNLVSYPRLEFVSCDRVWRRGNIWNSPLPHTLKCPSDFNCWYWVCQMYWHSGCLLV